MPSVKSTSSHDVFPHNLVNLHPSLEITCLRYNNVAYHSLLHTTHSLLQVTLCNFHNAIHKLCQHRFTLPAYIIWKLLRLGLTHNHPLSNYTLFYDSRIKITATKGAFRGWFYDMENPLPNHYPTCAKKLQPLVNSGVKPQAGLHTD